MFLCLFVVVRCLSAYLSCRHLLQTKIERYMESNLVTNEIFIEKPAVQIFIKSSLRT